MDRLNSLRVVTNIHFVRSQYLWCTIKQNTMKPGKPLHFKDPFSIEYQFHSFWELHHGHTLGCPLFNLLYLWKRPPHHHPYPNQTQTENKIIILWMVQIKDLKVKKCRMISSIISKVLISGNGLLQTHPIIHSTLSLCFRCDISARAYEHIFRYMAGGHCFGDCVLCYCYLKRPGRVLIHLKQKQQTFTIFTENFIK